MKKLLTLILVAIAMQSCSLTHLLPNYNYPSVDVTINIDLQPAWGPIGYDYAAYYYMPEINIYYDVNHSRFYYQSNNRWIGVEYLPPSYRVYDLFKIYKVVINYDHPWEYNRNHRSQYKHYRNDRSQIPIRLSNDHRYSKSWDNLRPWVDPDRRSNSKNDYKQHSQQKPNNKNQQNGYRGEEGYRPNQGAAAGGAYRDKDRTPSNGTPSYRNPQQRPQRPSDVTKAPTDKKQSSSSSGVSSRGNARTSTSNDNKPKPEAPKSNTHTTSRSTSDSSSSDSPRTTTSTSTATRGR